MISIVAASIASRRHHLLQRAHDQQDPSPPRHRHRHRHPTRPLSKKVPLVKQTSVISAQESESSASSVVAEDEYAHAMAARARLHARLRKNALATCPTRGSSSAPVLPESTSTCKYSRSSRLEPAVAPSTGDPSNGASSAPVLHESTFSTCKYSRPSRLEADAAPSTADPSNVHTHLTTIALSKPQTGPFIDSIPASAPIHNTSKQAEGFLLETDDCSICLESFSTGKILICWPCKHRFHYKCLTTWLAAHAQCPNCRAYILKISSSRALAGFPSTLYGLNFEKTVTSWKVDLRTSPSIN